MRTRTATDEAGARRIVKVEVEAGREVRDGTHTKRGNAPTQETEMDIMTGLQADMTVSVEIESTHIRVMSESIADEMIAWSAGGTIEIETMIDGVTTTIEDDKYVALTSSLAGTIEYRHLYDSPLRLSSCSRRQLSASHCLADLPLNDCPQAV